jgi:hypothetical protein
MVNEKVVVVPVERNCDPAKVGEPQLFPVTSTKALILMSQFVWFAQLME